MSDSVELDLKFLPAWLKEGPSTNRYADYEGEPQRDRRDDRRGPQRFGGGAGGGGPRGDRRGPGPGGPRPGGPGGPRPGGAGPGNRGPGGPGGQRDARGPGGYKGPGGPRPFGNKPTGDRPRPGYGPRPGQGERYEDRPPRQPEAPPTPMVRVEMLPEPAAAAGISKQIKTSARACGVFRVAKMFLERPERYRVRVTALAEDGMLYQIGDGPITFDRAQVERGAFRANRDRFYVMETVQGEAPKGNYTSVARHRFSGVLLGPPNHHSYQTASRKLYEERFSRRMSFPDFQREIENISDPAAVEQWKVQSSSKTVFKTRVEEGQEPVVFNTEAEAEQHFREHHLPALLKSAHSLEVAGPAAGVMLERSIAFPIRDLIERERRVPIGLVNALRPYFSEAGLHLFKWKRKILFASAIRPQRHPAEQTFSEGISALLTTIGENPGIKRPAIAQRLLGELPADSTESAAKISALASDLHYLVHIGYVVEFQNGSLELPPGRKDAQQQHAEESRLDVAAEMAELHDAPAGEKGAPAQGQGQGQKVRPPYVPRNQQPRNPERQERGREQSPAPTPAAAEESPAGDYALLPLLVATSLI